MQIQPVTDDIAGSLGLDEAKGALISTPQADSPAEKAGLKTGDVITKVDGKPIDDARDLARMIGGMAPNTKAELTVLRDGKEQTIARHAGHDERGRQATASPRPISRATSWASSGYRSRPPPTLPAPDSSGLVVTDVDPSGAAADAGIQTGDVILRIGERDIGSVKDLRQALSDATSRGRSKALALVKSAGGDQRYVALPASAA